LTIRWKAEAVQVYHHYLASRVMMRVEAYGVRLAVRADLSSMGGQHTAGVLPGIESQTILLCQSLVRHPNMS
jgi:hypothetical protein